MPVVDQSVRTCSAVAIRPTVREDKEALLSMLRATAVFKHDEEGIAGELLDEFFAADDPAAYRFYSAAGSDGKIAGFVCFGTTSIARGTYDLYWVVVDPGCHGKGIGGQLMRFAEETIRGEGGRLIIVETSSTTAYDPARRFYSRIGYQEVARVRAYYDVADDLVIFAKYLS